MLALRHVGVAAIAVAFVLATAAIDSADARRGGGGGMRGGGGFSGGGGMRGGGFGGGGMRGGAIGGGRGFAGRAHPSHPIARPGVGNRPGWAGRPGYGYGYRPGWGAAAAGVAVGAGLAYGAYGAYDPYYGYGYGHYDEGAYAAQPVVGQGDPIAECARRFRTYDPASQTYIVRKGVRASCP